MTEGIQYTIPGQPGRTKTAVLSFLRTELLYDIQNCAFVEGDIMKVESEHDRHQVLDIGEDGNIDRVTRMLDLAHAECVEALYPYSKEVIDAESSADDVLAEKETYTVSLLLPDDYSKTSLDLLTKYIHEYMVCRVLADWMNITKPDAAANWQAKAEQAKGAAKSLVNYRTGRVRRTQSPF